MGCDIHPVLEKKWKRDDGTTVWVGLHDFPYVTIKEIRQKGEIVARNYWHSPRAQWRNYQLFAKLAGVRGEGQDPKGLPNDASDLTLMLLSDCSDYHSHSWVSAREWVMHCLSLEEDSAELFLKPQPDEPQAKDPRVCDPYGYYLDIDGFNTAYGTEPEGDIGDYRICFCFDN